MRARARMQATLTVAALAASIAAAENIDPNHDGSRYVWAENVGWINGEPLGDGGSGLQVDDFELTGYMWGENIGWLSVSCKNDSTCGTTDYGVVNDGQGVLSGHAWAENVGWVNFAPSSAGVLIDAVTGDFSGRAWGENIGWITFASSAGNPFRLTTGWNCAPAPALPSGSTWLGLDRSGVEVGLSWVAVVGATGYDVVSGDLSTLRSSGGDFSMAVDRCLANNRTTTALSVPGGPPAGEGFWYLVRGENCGGRGPCDSGGPMQSGLRGAEVAASENDCP